MYGDEDGRERRVNDSQRNVFIDRMYMYEIEYKVKYRKIDTIFREPKIDINIHNYIITNITNADFAL